MKTGFPHHIIYASHPTDGSTIAITIGEPGFHPITTRLSIAELNGPNVEPAHVEAALAGSMFGWNTPGADPNLPRYRCLPFLRLAAIKEHVSLMSTHSVMALRSADVRDYRAAVVATAAIAARNDPAATQEGVWLRLASCGNADRDQHASLPATQAPPNAWVNVIDTDHASSVARGFITAYDLGGGNWLGGEVVDAGHHVATIAYNGRIIESVDARRTSSFQPR